MRPTDVAYCAGLFDGEGSVAAHRAVRRARNYKGRTYEYGYPPFLQLHIGVQHLGAMEFFRDTFGLATKIRRGNGIWNLSVPSKQAEMVARAMLPYLRIKRHQMELFLEFLTTVQHTKRSHGLPVGVREHREEIAAAIRADREAVRDQHRADLRLVKEA